MPAGLSYSEASPEDGIVKEAILPSPVAEDDSSSSTTSDSPAADLISQLEQEDGDATLPMFAQTKKIKRVATRKPASSAASSFDSETELGEDDMDKLYRSTASKKMDSKFVRLSDILPPVPSKGDFELDKIRSSLYFFS